MHEELNEQIRQHTGGARDLSDAVHGYLREVVADASVLGIGLEYARVYPAEAKIEIELVGVPGLQVSWEPRSGWYYQTQQAGTYYRVSREADAASRVPDAETVAAWLQLIDSGELQGHDDRPDPLDPQDQALVERLATIGAGQDPYTPG